MPFSFCILHQQDVPSLELSFFTQGSFNLYLPVQEQDKLTLGCGMKIVVICGLHCPEHDVFGRDFFGKKSYFSRFFKRDTDFFKPAFPFRIAINPGDIEHVFLFMLCGMVSWKIYRMANWYPFRK